MCSVVEPTISTKPEILSLPGTISAWYEASIFAQVSGYIQSWRTDIGAVVKKGDVLAEVETPELDERIAKAREEVSRAQAALDLAKVTAERWAALRNSSAVSKQSADEKSERSTGQAGRCRRGRRPISTGSRRRKHSPRSSRRSMASSPPATSISALSSRPERTAQPLFKVADIHAVRIYVKVPQIYSGTPDERHEGGLHDAAMARAEFHGRSRHDLERHRRDKPAACW